ncbi:type II toxin-antitoxin system RelE/ParE family toxin [Autumnicola musiva]|uniref:Type II toxin-antitoxin system RelE/ParE family toxin n=1 Tax=Autumnicola musiva TaxID=3075589 RepID=A0ABU3D1E5_9FLAO|nr:type II toxin-antitoxin system RelE/ParE family toxin [Zunongwangia sp. F117]MDT0675294.1 type II toxin-antitoxin system RelE/ParE family toxin [Zunongwangia sp. F117]
MAFEILVTTEAKADIVEGVEWYEAKSDGLGEKFLNEIELKLKYISRFPEYFQVRSTGFREVQLNKFPYVIVYSFRKNEVVILAVFSTHQNPSKKT